MSSYRIDVDDELITEQISKIVGSLINRELQEQLNVSSGLVADAAREIIYSHKDEIVNAVIERATKEISKKALPKLLDRLSKGEEDD